MNYQHQHLASGRWNELALAEQLANVGSEVGRVISWREKDKEMSKKAFYRALELLNLTIGDPKNASRLKELCRVKEMLADQFEGENFYRSKNDQWEKYFHGFNFLARRGKG